MRGGAEQVRQPCQSRVGSPTAAGGQMQVAVHGLGQSMQHDLFGHRDAAQIGDERDPCTGCDEGELGGEVGGFGDGVGGNPARPQARSTIS